METLDWENLIKRFTKSHFNKKFSYACPICEVAMSIDFDDGIIVCKNKCFTFKTVSIFFNKVIIFGETIKYRHAFTDDIEDIEKNKNAIIEIKNKIEYLRKDYRYIAEILERS